MGETDTISRQAAIDAPVKMVSEGIEWIPVYHLKDLPSAQPDENDQEFIKLTVRYSNGRPYYSIIYLEYDKNGVGHDFVGYSSYSLDVISDYLKKYFMPSAQPEPQWIPVSERLPEDMQYVLLTVRRLNNAYNPRPFISVGYIGWNQHHWWCAHDGDCEISKVEVLAWMPLPKPFEGGIK